MSLMKSKVTKEPVAIASTLFSGDISFEIFMSDYLNKKPCVLSYEGSDFVGHTDGSDINEILTRAGRMTPNRGKFRFFLPHGETTMDVSELYTEEKVLGLKSVAARSKLDGKDIEYKPFKPSLKAHMVRQLFRLGGSLRIYFADEFDKKIAKTMKCFEDVFQTKFGSTLFYHGISNKNAFTPHHLDLEGFFAVQIKGEKRWIITKSLVNGSRREFLHQLEDSTVYDALYNESKKQVVMDVVLKPGQVLYVPPFYGHSVQPSGAKDNEILHLTFMMLNLTFDDFREWKKKTVYQPYDREMSRMDLMDVSKSLAQMSDFKWQSSTDEIEEFKRFVEDNSYSNMSDGFVIQESVSERVARDTDESACYCPIFAPRFVDNGDHISLTINTEEYQLEPGMANYFKVLLERLFERKECKIMTLVNLPELTDKEMLVETLQALFDNGIINIS